MSATLSEVRVFNPQPFIGRGHPEPCYRLCVPWPRQGLPTRIYTSAATRADSAGILRPAVPAFLPRKVRGYAMRDQFRPALRRESERRGLRGVGPGSVCYFWPTASDRAMAEARERGGTVVVEFINTHVSHAYGILEDEYRRIGAPLPDWPLEQLVADEERRLELADAVFAPGPFVAESIRRHGRTRPAILETSYGVDLPAGYPFPLRAEEGPVRFLFVGSVGIRKGAHVLFEAWDRARLDAELLVVGPPEDFIAERYLRHLGPGVQHRGFQPDLAPIYRGADVFVFPSLEEGDPQVTYLAAAYGLPLVVTPMGGAKIARNRENALVVPPSDPAALAEALREIAEDAALRRRLARQVTKDAQEFTWDRVAARRREALLGLGAAE